MFQYHGAEHKAIAAYENDVELTPEAAQQFTTAHVRCGTNFLLTVMVVAVFVYSVIPRPNLWFVIGSRIVLMPVIAGLSYEVIRLAAKNMQRRWVRVLVRPGLLLQKLTTREPDLDQLEVAIASLRAVLTAEQRAEVEARVGRRVPAVAPGVLSARSARPSASTLPAMIDVQLTWTERELLAGHDIVEPLVAGGVRCHGGFDANGEYVSPRTRNRVPAIAAWQQSHREQFGTEILDAPLELWPEVFPNVAQSKYLLREGVREPTISSLTRIGTVEGFGSMIRAVQGRPAAVALRRVDRRHRDRAPAGRPVRGARARRSRLGRRRRPQADVVRGPRHRVRAPGHRRHDADDAGAHGHRRAGRQAADARRGAARRGGDAPLPRSRPLVGDDAAAHGRAAASSRCRRSTRSRGPRRCSPTATSSPATARRPRS